MLVFLPSSELKYRCEMRQTAKGSPNEQLLSIRKALSRSLPFSLSLTHSLSDFTLFLLKNFLYPLLFIFPLCVTGVGETCVSVIWSRGKMSEGNFAVWVEPPIGFIKFWFAVFEWQQNGGRRKKDVLWTKNQYNDAAQLSMMNL